MPPRPPPPLQLPPDDSALGRLLALCEVGFGRQRDTLDELRAEVTRAVATEALFEHRLLIVERWIESRASLEAKLALFDQSMSTVIKAVDSLQAERAEDRKRRLGLVDGLFIALGSSIVTVVIEVLVKHFAGG